MTTPPALILATVLASPTLYGAFLGDVTIGDAATRYLICIPVAAVMLALLRGLTNSFGPVQMNRRSTDDSGDRRATDEAG